MGHAPTYARRHQHHSGRLGVSFYQVILSSLTWWKAGLHVYWLFLSQTHSKLTLQPFLCNWLLHWRFDWSSSWLLFVWEDPSCSCILTLGVFFSPLYWRIDKKNMKWYIFLILDSYVVWNILIYWKSLPWAVVWEHNRCSYLTLFTSVSSEIPTQTLPMRSAIAIDKQWNPGWRRVCFLLWETLQYWLSCSKRGLSSYIRWLVSKGMGSVAGPHSNLSIPFLHAGEEIKSDEEDVIEE